MSATCDHNINPATDRCVMCGKNRFQRKTAFLWRTMEGEVLTLEQMETKHLFNSMKMCFNHIAEVYGGRPVWFKHSYSDYFERARLEPVTVAGYVVIFMKEIDRRGDLPAKYHAPYADIVSQIKPMMLRRPPLAAIAAPFGDFEL
jgi:hypothetical protein